MYTYVYIKSMVRPVPRTRSTAPGAQTGPVQHRHEAPAAACDNGCAVTMMIL